MLQEQKQKPFQKLFQMYQGWKNATPESILIMQNLKE